MVFKLKRGKMDGLTRKKKRRMAALKEDGEAQAQLKVAARKVKQASRQGKLTQFTDKSAVKPPPTKNSKPKKKQGRFDSDATVKKPPASAKKKMSKPVKSFKSQSKHKRRK
jgi:hypothetical protein